MSPKEVDGSLLQLYIDGRCSPEQLTTIRQYLQHPDYRESLEKWLHTSWTEELTSQPTVAEASPDQYQQFLSIVQDRETDPERVPQRVLGRMPARKWWRTAAAAVLVALVGLAGLQWWNTNKEKQHAARDQEWVLMQNGPGKRTRIVLPDSSIVYLGGAGRLQYNKNFGASNRNLVLEGEAYFIVKHTTQPPFSVKTGAITTVDIGTAFNIRHHPAELTIQVTVAEGAVKVVEHPSAASATSLRQWQQFTFNTTTRQSIVQLLPEQTNIGGWREGILNFKKQPMWQIAADLERYYGVTIRFAKPATAGLEITTTLNNASLQQAMDIIAQTAGVHWKKSGTTILVQ